MSLGIINGGVTVISAERVPWQHDDDPMVKALCDSRGVVMFERGGKSDAICMRDIAIIWERTGARFRAFPLAPAPARVPVVRWPMWCVTVPIEDGLLAVTYDDKLGRGCVAMAGAAKAIGRNQLAALVRTFKEWPL